MSVDQRLSSAKRGSCLLSWTDWTWTRTCCGTNPLLILLRVLPHPKLHSYLKSGARQQSRVRTGPARVRTGPARVHRSGPDCLSRKQIRAAVPPHHQQRPAKAAVRRRLPAAHSRTRSREVVLAAAPPSPGLRPPRLGHTLDPRLRRRFRFTRQLKNQSEQQVPAWCLFHPPS